MGKSPVAPRPGDSGSTGVGQQIPKTRHTHGGPRPWGLRLRFRTRMPDPAAATDDDRDLARAGYRPQFRRGLGAFTAFAAGFSYLSILTGIVQNFALGYREAGPAFVWTWPVVLAGQFCLALCFAELARR